MNFLTTAMAVYAVAYALTKKRGPADLFAAVREWAVSRFGAESNIAAGLQCPVCASFWLAWVVPLLPLRVQRALAFAGVVVVIERVAESQRIEIGL